MEKKLAVIAIGGNSLIENNKRVTVESQYKVISKTANYISKLAEEGYRVLIVHGNGPQVGYILRRAEIASTELHTVPLDSCVADTEGAIGYQIQNALYNAFIKDKKNFHVVSIVTQVVVDEKDASFSNPAKPIGSFMNKEVAFEHKEKDGWNIIEDSGRGYRRVVPSPVPIKVIELDAIKTLLDSNFIVVAAGGGGIPVVLNNDGTIKGKEAVVDKDLVASLLAKELNADLFIITTAVDSVYINYGKENQEELRTLSVGKAKDYIKMGEFPPGSMLPKIEAITSFVESTGKRGIITSPEKIMESVSGESGTTITEF